MSENDPHVHVERQVLLAGAAARDAVASLLGVVTDLPSVVTTACGLRVPYAMTSPRPESVTCLPCREHAHQECLRYVEQVDSLSRMPGMNITSDQAAKAAERVRDLAKRFAGQTD
ncbi:MAG TPA: hypothetical protein VJT49_21820 [Amycolatopsis sp.]|uniref:hypothetical protein n=1 Tax=Amycolatopsis sp. TaxID=37632 RepID=UPI002B4636D8|nr:hypothetical protein [Amycolatopsis sp.]HKS47699.1 hypothetical protein [Amycolatopsis sp.]